MFLLKKYKVKNIFKEDIEPEEIFLDALKIKQESDEGQLERPLSAKVFIYFYALIVLFLLIFFLRSIELQALQGDYFASLAEKNRTRFILLPAPRGIIYDRFEKPLVYNKPSFDLVISPLDLPKESNKIAALIKNLSEILDEPAPFIEEQIFEATKEKSPQKFLLATNLNHQKVLIFQTRQGDLPGVRLEASAIRDYLFGPIAAHFLGYLSKMSTADLKKYPNYFLTEKIGREGLEKFYEKELRGQPGYLEIEIDAFGREKRVLNKKEAAAGQSLILGIDIELQKRLYESLSRYAPKPAAAIALNPQNGLVLALVSLPSFDNNLFARSVSQKDLAAVLDYKQNALFNRVLAGQYPPGSTIKPFVAAAGLEEGIINRYTKINDDKGEIVLLNQYNSEIVYSFKDWQAHGTTDIIKAIAESCNVFFYYLGGGYQNFEGLGIERLSDYFEKFGFNKPMGIDIFGEASGLIPDKTWKEEVKGEKWFIGDTYHASIGQGDISVTPLQLASATAAIANQGILFQPRLVDKIIDSDKNIVIATLPRIINQNFIQGENLKIVRQGMRQTILSGSARSLIDLPVDAAGKTGTAQFGQGQTHAWFTSFAPYNDPEIVLVILIEGGGEGSSTAVPVAKEIYQWYFLRNK